MRFGVRQRTVNWVAMGMYGGFSPMMALEIILVCLAVPAVAASGYLLLGTLLSSKPALPKKSSRTLRFDVIVPAHNEAGIIERTVSSLQRIDWPKDSYRIIVVADNCTDATAEIARGAGAEVMQRPPQMVEVPPKRRWR